MLIKGYRGDRLQSLVFDGDRRAGALIVIAWIVYFASVFVFGPRFDFWPIVAIVPVVFTAWVYGPVVGGLAGLATFAFHAPVWERLTGESFASGSGIAGTLTLGVIGAIIGFSRYLALSMNAEAERLRVSEAKFKAVFDSAPIPLAVVGPDRVLAEVNQAICDFLGYTKEELIGMSPEAVTAPGHWEENMRRMDEAAAGAVDSYSLHKAWQRKDQTIVEGLLKVAKYTGVDGETYFVPQILDMTDQVAAENVLRQQIAARDTFLGAVSHELRTPLTAVTGLAHELGERWDDFSDEERRDLVLMVASQGDDVAQLVEDLLVATQPEQEGLALSIEPLKLGSELDIVLGARAGILRPDEIHGSASEALGDRLRVRQVVRNLLSNASRYGGDHVRVELTDDGPWARLQVIDNGDGVSAEQVDRIFEAYGRAHGPPSDHGATGLGLSVSRRLARLMDGDLTYARVEGHTEFTLMLPLAP